MKSDNFLDATSLACPMPVVRTKQAMDQMDSGQVIEVHVTDKGALKDIPAWAKTAGHDVLEQKEEEGLIKFWIRKG